MGLGFGDEEREKQAQRELAAYCKRGEFASRCRKEKRSDGVQGQGSSDGGRGVHVEGAIMMQRLVRRLEDVFPATVEEQFGTEGARGGFSWSMRGLGRQPVGVDWAGASLFELPTAVVARRLEGGMVWRGEDASAAAGDEIAHICGVVMLLGLLPEEKRSPSLDFVSPTPGFVLDVVSHTQAASNSRYTARSFLHTNLSLV